MVNTAPSPGALRTEIVLPGLSTMLPVIASPSPVPWPSAFVVKKGSKILAWMSGGIPGPLSAISMETRSRAAS
jgi:hypothetical protein